MTHINNMLSEISKKNENENRSDTLRENQHQNFTGVIASAHPLRCLSLSLLLLVSRALLFRPRAFVDAQAPTDGCLCSYRSLVMI